MVAIMISYKKSILKVYYLIIDVYFESLVLFLNDMLDV